MSLTIMEVLQNANHNLNEGLTPLQGIIGKEQLRNAVSLLEKGHALEDEFIEKEMPEPEYKHDYRVKLP